MNPTGVAAAPGSEGAEAKNGTSYDVLFLCVLFRQRIEAECNRVPHSRIIWRNVGSRRPSQQQ